MAKKKKKKSTSLAKSPAGYESVLGSISKLLEEARRTSARSVNAIMTHTYWKIGRRIVEYQQGGEARAEYGRALLKRLSADLEASFGRGFSVDNLENMRRFYRAYPDGPKSETASPISLPGKSETPSRISLGGGIFPLPWSHYVRLLSVKKQAARISALTRARVGCPY